MTTGLFNYPQTAAFGRVLPKNKVYAFAKTSRRIRDLFAAEITQLVWRFKLAPETVNLPSGPNVAEIQIFGVELKPGIGDISEELLLCIDKAIAFPTVFEITRHAGPDKELRVIAAYKRPSAADSSKHVVGEYFASNWLPASTLRSPLPVSLDLNGLYEHLLRQLVPITARAGEPLQALAERYRIVVSKQREVQQLAARLIREEHFNRKVELNALMRSVQAEVDALSGTHDSRGTP